MTELLKALAEEAAMYEALLTLLVDKRKALVGLKTADLDSLVAREEALLSRIAEADVARRRAAGNASAVLGLPAEATLREIASASRSRELSTMRDRLSGLMRDVARANDINRQLADQSLDHVHMFLRALTGLEGDGAAYTKRGTESGAQAPRVNLLDSVA